MQSVSSPTRTRAAKNSSPSAKRSQTSSRDRRQAASRQHAVPRSGHGRGSGEDAIKQLSATSFQFSAPALRKHSRGFGFLGDQQFSEKAAKFDCPKSANFLWKSANFGRGVGSILPLVETLNDRPSMALSCFRTRLTFTQHPLCAECRNNMQKSKKNRTFVFRWLEDGTRMQWLTTIE